MSRVVANMMRAGLSLLLGARALTSTSNRASSPTLPGSRQPRVILVGLDSMQGLGAARVLASRGVPVIALAKNGRSDWCRTRVCEEIIVTDTETEALIDTLEDIGPSLPERAVLVPCTDASVRLVSRHRRRLEPWYHVLLPPHEVVEMLMDKTSFYTYAKEHDLPIPETYFIRSRPDLVAVIDELTFPCILKPANSATSLWEQNTDISAFRVASRDELLAIYDETHEWTDVFILQEWIEGPDSNLYSCNCYFDADSNPLVTFVARKLRQWPPHVGKSCLGEECRNDTVLRETLRLLGGVGYRGLGYVEFKLNERTGEYVIVEPNIGRPTGRSAIAEAGGVELLYTMYSDAVGLPLPPQREQTYRGAKWIHLRHDLQSALYYRRRGDLTFRLWWASWRGKKFYALFSWSDPAPFFSDIARTARSFLSWEGRSGYSRRLTGTVGEPVRTED
jgi:predicted ATP-grasp superfamily ATP-dependent carboligase